MEQMDMPLDQGGELEKGFQKKWKKEKKKKTHCFYSTGKKQKVPGQFHPNTTVVETGSLQSLY